MVCEKGFVQLILLFLRADFEDDESILCSCTASF
jgi:hypothetical protein